VEPVLDPVSSHLIYDDHFYGVMIDFLFDLFDMSRPNDDRAAPGWWMVKIDEIFTHKGDATSMRIVKRIAHD